MAETNATNDFRISKYALFIIVMVIGYVFRPCKISMIHPSQLRFTAMVCAAVMLSVLVGLEHCTDSEMEEEILALSFASALLGYVRVRNDVFAEHDLHCYIIRATHVDTNYTCCQLMSIVYDS